MPPTFLRPFLLVMAGLAILTATVLDGVMMRYMMQPMLRKLERMSPGPVVYPPAMQFVLERSWVRRLYHLLFAALLLGVWWYVGTPAGAARLR
jgi:hypothetical protein